MVLQHSRYYYIHLSDKEKTAYRTIYESWIKGNSKAWIKGNPALDIQKVVDALFSDNPELFFVDRNTLYFVKSVLGWEVKGDFHWNGKELEHKKAELDQATRLFLQGVRKEQTEEEQFRVLHDNLAKQVSYNHADMEERQNYTIYGTLCRKTAVCEGISKAYKYLCDQVGLPSLVVSGRSLEHQDQQEGHAWNIIRTDSGKAHVDVTWDIPFFQRTIEGIYFGMSDAEIERDHFWDRSLVPICEGFGSRFLEVCSSREMESVIIEAIQKHETEICVSFNRKFDSEKQILHMVKKYIEKNFFLWSGTIEVSYMKQTDRAVIRLQQ